MRLSHLRGTESDVYHYENGARMTCSCDKPQPGMKMNGRTTCKICGGDMAYKGGMREALMAKMQAKK